MLDVREEDPFAQEHPLFAANVPLSKLELEIYARVPRRDTPVTLYDDGEGLAQIAAQRLAGAGLQQRGHSRRRARRLARGRRRVVQGRERAEQGVRRTGGGRAPHAIAGRGGSTGAARRPGRRGGARCPPLRRIPDHEHPRRHQRAGRRTGAARRRTGAGPAHPASSSTAPGAPAASSAPSRWSTPAFPTRCRRCATAPSAGRWPASRLEHGQARRFAEVSAQ